MKFAVLITFLVLSVSLHAATPEQEKTFLDNYRKALESNDTKSLSANLYTVGAPPKLAEFFTMMVTLPIPPGSKLSSVELVTPSPEELTKMNEPKAMPDGQTYVMPLKPIKQLVITVENSDPTRAGKNTSKLPIAEKDGKLVIPVPVLAK